jgi:hypothetical protein
MTDTVDVNATPVEDPLESAIMNLQFSVKEINAILNILNTPWQTPVMTWANLITAIQNQCAPQINALNQPAQNADGVSSDLEGKN